MRLLVSGILVLLTALRAGAHTPASATGSQASTPSRAPDTFTYDAGGRRDPFLSIVGSGVERRPEPARGEGAAGLTIGEISLRGIVQGRGVLIAIVQGPDTKTYLVHQGDEFADGTITSITLQGLVVVQEVNDPLSPVRQREVRKPLRSTERAMPRPFEGR
jgi:hypothetical protein